MADYLTTNTELSSVADAIRQKTHGTDLLMYPNEFIAAISSLDCDPINVIFTVNENMDLLAHTLSFDIDEDMELSVDCDNVVFNITDET